MSGDWHGRDPFCTAFFNAVSLGTPETERFVIDAVRCNETEIRDPALQAAANRLVSDEASHRRAHQLYNDTLCLQRGYDQEQLSMPFRRRFETAKRRLRPIEKLQVSVVIEHLTTTFATGILGHREWLQGADGRVAALWRWHANEEIQHRSVAFNVYFALGGKCFGLRRALPKVTLQLLSDNLHATAAMLRHDGHGSEVVARGLWQLYGRPGMFRRLAGKWLALFWSGYHPQEIVVGDGAG